MINSKYRKIIVIEADSISDACQIVTEGFKKNLKEISIIDTTSDLNQNKWLGQELRDTLIFFDNKTKLNALLAIFSCVLGGFSIYISVSSKQKLSYFKDNFLLKELKKLEKLTLLPHIQAEPIFIKEIYTQFQEIIEQVLSTNYSIVQLIGLRGTGKSTILGTIANSALKYGKINIALVSQYKTSSQKTFDVLNDVSRETIEYFSPKEINLTKQKFSIILIDESACLPKEFIQSMIEKSKNNKTKVVLATTIEGYEGTGQSYRLHNIKKTEHLVIYMNQTVRFSNRDPLHNLCLSICNPKINKTDLEDGDYMFNTIELREKSLTESCFEILQQSHYKTTPNDLERFYNDDAIFGLTILSNKIISVLYAIPEQLPGQIKENTRELQNIFFGTRRVKSALTQQALINSYGVNKNLVSAKILRISRIATNKENRRFGNASRLIEKLVRQGQKQNYDFLSTSFSLTDSSYQFWEAMKFKPVRIGINRNKASNKYSILMLLDLSNNEKLVNFYNNKFYQHINYFKKYYNGSENDILKYSRTDEILQKKMSVEEMNKELESVVFGYRDIHWILPNVNIQFQNDRKGLKYLKPILTGLRIEKSNLENAKLLLKSYMETKDDIIL